MEDLNRYVCLRNARLAHQSDGDADISSTNTTLDELLKFSHRLSLQVTMVNSTSSESSQASNGQVQVVPYPQYVRVLDEIPALQDMEWATIREKSKLPDIPVFPSLFQYSLIEKGVEPIGRGRDVHKFRSHTLHRFIRLFWNQFVKIPSLFADINEIFSGLADPERFGMSVLEFEMDPKSDECLVYLMVGRHEIPLFFIHYIAPHDVSAAQVKGEIIDLTFDKDILRRGGMQSTLIATMTRAFARMVSTGIRYSVLDTGEAVVFLHGHSTHPDLLGAHKFIPCEEIGDDVDDKVYQTIVAQYLSFIFRAMREKPSTQHWYATAGALRTCKLTNNGVERIVQSSNFLTPSSRNDPFFADSNLLDENGRLFCTHKCLLGLCAGAELDHACPNYEEHGNRFHEIGPTQLIEFLYRQIEKQDPPYAFRPMYLHGQHHHYLKGVLDDYGYTFLVKAVEPGHEETLGREYNTYQNLEAVQGFIIPVCLGVLDLQERLNRCHVYYGREFEKMMLLSCSGVSPVDFINKEAVDTLTKEREKLKEDIEEMGLLRPDVSWRNLLWNEQEHCLVWINFVEDKSSD
ncbi:hypothetical protein BGW36DRAFT_427849 [Talaromyces proteolyticus]|uniref:Uncharacterized protein n=1 Tax=Talaromyces proteolyticus TaxID=1131652 RepID=A0AAD4KRZ7_9EURO|nr:uncharacterized protein BGW36DRAFT_427849 [Talaromyces proteolyticus]KAH8697910.1 hypothetical protein BGW36DRAFT_427849 [Talaromyces proteolyticus]